VTKASESIDVVLNDVVLNDVILNPGFDMPVSSGEQRIKTVPR